MEQNESFCAVKPNFDPSIPSVGSDDEDSFVVLGTSSLNEEDVNGSLNDDVLPPIRSNKVHDMQNLLKMEISQINNSGVLPEVPSVVDASHAPISSATTVTLSPDASHEEVQKQVEELIKENEKLKNIIAQNNLSMKAQYDRILAWKDDVNSVMTSYKDKFVEAKNYIDKCKEENYKLANDVEKYKNIKELQDEEIMNLKKREKENYNTVSTSAEQNMVEFDLQVAKKKVEELHTELAETKLKKAEIAATNEELTEKLHTIQTEVEELNMKNMKSEDLQMQLKAASQTNIEELNMKNTKIENLLMRFKESTDNNYKLKNKIEELEEKLQAEKQHNLQDSIDSINKNKLRSCEKRINELEQENYSLKEEIAGLNFKLTKTETYGSSLKENNIHLSEQLMHSQKSITALDDEINKKIKEIEELRVLLQESNKNDEMFALNEQLVIYKKDFEAEQAAKEEMKREKQQIAEDLQNLQKRNKQLQNEIDVLRARTEQSNPDGYVCPKCSFTFKSYQALENHVHRCLDVEGFP